jgi:hypothetical protein
MYNGPYVNSFNTHDDYVTQASVINNKVVQGYDFTEEYVARFVWMNTSSSVYLSGNTDTGNDWNYIRGNDLGNTVRVDSPPISSGRVDILTRDQIDDYILANVGARPWDRAEADQQVLDDYVAGEGRIVDCVDADDVLYDGGTAQGATANTITLDDNAAPADRAYEFKSIEILSGTGAGQRRDVASYQGSSRVLTVTPDWDVVPDGSSTYTMIVNCDNNAGGWRLLESSQWVPNVPSNPHADPNANGYTNLEEWLHTLNPIAGDIPEEAENRFTIYPNPSTGYVTIESLDTAHAAQGLYIFSFSGATLAHEELDQSWHGGSTELDISFLQSGIYLVGIRYDDRMATKKLVVL